MSLTANTYLKEDLLAALEDPQTKQGLSDLLKDLIPTSLDFRMENAASNVCSFGIGIGLSFVGVVLAKKYKKSNAARAIARILGADIEGINRDFVFHKLKEDKKYFLKIQEKLVNFISAGDLHNVIDLFATEFNLTSEEAAEVYLAIKDVILDRQIIGSIIQLLDLTSTLSQESNNAREKIEQAIYAESDIIQCKIEKELNQVASKIKSQFESDLDRLRLSQSNLTLITPFTFAEMGHGNTDCWKAGYFRLQDIKDTYDARRNLTTELINLTDSEPWTILFGGSGSGKTMLLQRVMLEQVTNGYAVIYTENLGANARSLGDLLKEVSQKFPKVLMVADNVHRSGSEELFKCFNDFYDLKQYGLKILMAARENQFHTFRSRLVPDHARAVNYSLNHLHQIRLGFDITDANIICSKAAEIYGKSEFSENTLREITMKFYKECKGSLIMFLYYVIYYFTKARVDSLNVLVTDFNEKINILGDHDGLWRAAIFCSFTGMFGIELKEKFLIECGVGDQIVPLIESGFLFLNVDPNNKTQYEIRHERWALEFLVFIFTERFKSNSNLFKSRHPIKGIIQCILNNIKPDELLNIIYECTSLYLEEDKRNRPLGEVIVQNTFIPDHLSINDKVKSYGAFGEFYHSVNDNVKAIEAFNKAIELSRKSIDINPDLMAVISCNKGNICVELGLNTQALTCYDEAIEKNPNEATTWFNKGTLLRKIERYDEATECYSRGIELDPRDAKAWQYKGDALYSIGRYEEALACYNESVQLKPNDLSAVFNRANTLTQLRRAEEAGVGYDKALALDRNSVTVWLHKAKNMFVLGNYNDALKCFNKVIELDPNHRDPATWNFQGSTHYALGKYNDAIRSIDKAIELDETFAQAWYNKGLALMRLGYESEARDCFRKANELGLNF